MEPLKMEEERWAEVGCTAAADWEVHWGQSTAWGQMEYYKVVSLGSNTDCPGEGRLDR